MNKDLEHIKNDKGNEGFTIPKTYFKDFEDNLFAKIKEESLPKTTGFKTPDNYFNNLENNILNKVTSKNTTKVISLRKRVLQFIPSVAAACVLLFIGLQYINTNSTTISIDDINATEIANWLEINHDGNFSSEIAYSIANNELNFDDLATVNIQEESIEDYLNTVDSEIIIEEIE